MKFVLLAGAAACLLIAGQAVAASSQPQIGGRSAPILTVEGLRFRDLNRSGALDPYEDWRLTPQTRAADLVGRMTLEEKAGTMMHGTAPTPGFAPSPGQGYQPDQAKAVIIGKGVTSLITRLGGDTRFLAEQNNMLQEIAEGGRLGVPVTVSTDPRSHFAGTLGMSVDAGSFSQWPEAPGLAAIGDPALTRRFGDIARQEYRAVGIHQALSPQADLATEPRWPRISGTFGEDPQTAKVQVQAYVEGFQGGAGGLTSGGVATVVKHWVGYGAAKDGWDSHNAYGKYAAFPGGAFNQHLIPFEGAFAANGSAVMPTYSILENLQVDGKPVEQVGGGFNAFLLSDLLRGRYGFKGVVLSDWAITSDCPAACIDGAPSGPPSIGMPWGVESLSQSDRMAKAINVGVDQIGGSEETGALVAAVKAGKIAPARIDAAAARILALKFQMGLFENPYADPAAAQSLVGNAAFRAEGEAAQRRSLVLLRNEKALLPLKAGTRVWLHGVKPEAAAAAGLTVVDAPAKADVALVRVATPHQMLHPNHFFGRMHHEGDLDFKDGDAGYEALKAARAAKAVVVDIYLDRPAILTNVKDKADAIIGNFGASDGALLDIVTGKARPEGKLPFELPSSMEAVRRQAPDKPHDSAAPLYPIGAGLRF